VIISQTDKNLPAIAAAVARGGVIAFRTDTFYGLGADPFNQQAVSAIKTLKGREDHKPILIVISDLKQLARFISGPSATLDRLARKFWPGPLTLIGKAQVVLPLEITAGTETVGVRLPNDDKVRGLVSACGGALTATSANPSQSAPAVNATEVLNYFGERLELIVDAGECGTDLPSTVVDVTGDTPQLIRAGVITWPQIQAVAEREQNARP